MIRKDIVRVAICLALVAATLGCGDKKMRARVAALDDETLVEISDDYPEGSESAVLMDQEFQRRGVTATPPTQGTPQLPTRERKVAAKPALSSGAVPQPPQLPGGTMSFQEAGITFPVPAGWMVVSGKGLKTDVFVEATQAHADGYAKTNPELSCFIQMRKASEPRPTICLIPGLQFVKGTPENGNLKGGTVAVAGVLASQLAWLACGKEPLPRLSREVVMMMKTFAGKEEF